MHNFEDSFLYAMEKTVQYFTTKYHCMAIFGSDEVSFIFENPMILLKDLDTQKDNHSNEVISLFSQYVYDYFNKFDKHKKVFFHAKGFSIPKEKVTSYIKYRSTSIKNVMVTYFLKRKQVLKEAKLQDKIKQCESLSDFKDLKTIYDGILYKDGNKLDILEFLKGNIVKIDKVDYDNKFVDLLNF